MDSDYVQHVRYKLQKRLKRLNTASQETFRATLVQTWAFLQENSITKAILDDLERRVPEAEKWAETITANEGRVLPGTELENDAIAYWVLKKCATAPLNQDSDQHGNLQLHLLENTSSHLEPFRLEYVEPLFDYIDEQIDDKRIVLALLRKYKHRCEWFRRVTLLASCNDNTRQGENTLAYDLYEYLHDQGIEFHIEPESAAGRVDLISAQSGMDRLVADTKLFNPTTGQDCGYIIKGFRQVYDYLNDFNELFGYLVIFKTCQQDLAISTNQQESAIPFICHNNKTIFILIIDICDYPDSASKRGKLRAYEITPENFVESLRCSPLSRQFFGWY
jgi:hypothetical protein